MGLTRRTSDLLAQIGTQTSLVLENALAYGRLRASRDDLEEQRLYLESEIESEFNFEDIVGKSAAIRKVLDQVTIDCAHQFHRVTARRDRCRARSWWPERFII